MIAILSDFSDSEYLGVMKGAIFLENPKSKITDLYNKVSPYNIKEGAWILLNSYKYFPKKTTFLCVVDPGVGGKRKGIAVETTNYYFVGPDNGLMWPAIKEDGIKRAVVLRTNNTSKTFHGRDIFAKAAAMLERRENIKKLGKETNVKNKLEFYLKGRTGEIVRIDNFGNIITNLRSLGKKEYNVILEDKIKMPFYKTYEEAKAGSLFLIKGSSGTLEISIKNKKAIEALPINVGCKITIS